MVKLECGGGGSESVNNPAVDAATVANDDVTDKIRICIGQDPRPHGMRLADAFARGVESVEGVRALYNGLSTTPSMFEFCKYVFLRSCLVLMGRYWILD